MIPLGTFDDISPFVASMRDVPNVARNKMSLRCRHNDPRKTPFLALENSI